MTKLKLLLSIAATIFFAACSRPIYQVTTYQGSTPIRTDITANIYATKSGFIRYAVKDSIIYHWGGYQIKQYRK